MEAERVLTAARQHNLFAVDDNASARLMTYASSAIEAVGLSSQSPFAPSVLSGWAEEELRELRSEKRPLLAHMTGACDFMCTCTYPRPRPLGSVDDKGDCARAAPRR